VITVTPICTGAARMKRAQQAGREGRTSFGRKVDIFRDTEWVGPSRIFCFLIEHPEGRFLVYTGDTAENSTPGYLQWWNPFFTKMVEIKVAGVEEIVLAGDATYTEANLRADRVDEVTYDPSVSLSTLRAIKSFAAQELTVLLPSHDPDGLARLANRTLL
jgi:hypothetical protein